MGTETITYDKAGRIKEKANSVTGYSKSYSYYKDNSIRDIKTRMDGDLVYSENFGYDKNGNKIYEDQNGDIRKYTYDGLNRLTGAEIGNVRTEYEFDSFNNISREYEIIGGRIEKKTYYYDNANRLLLEDGQRTVQYEYDNSGNLIKKITGIGNNAETAYYRYDGYNRLTGYIDDYSTAEYSYNINGLRESKTVNGTKTRYIYNGADIVGEIFDDNIYTYYRGTELIGYTNNRGDRYYYRQNSHGDVTALLTVDGQEKKTYSYNAYGKETSFSLAPMGSQTVVQLWRAETEQIYNPFRYCGEYQDLSSGLIYLRNRYYDPSVGRFISEDPARDGFNWYVYCGNNPVMFVDPSGNIREPGYVNGVWCENPDAYEFGKKSDTYKILVDLGNRWESGTSKQRDEYSALAENIRRLAREGTPIQYAQDKILNQLHKNAKVATDYQATMTTGFSGFMYQLGGGNYLADSSSFLIGMAYGDWNYKYDSNWQVPYDYFDGNDMNVDNNKNWRPWMYFDGMLVSADKFGNINMAYVGVKMGLPYSVFQNFATTDKDDAFWVQYGINMAEQGR